MTSLPNICASQSRQLEAARITPIWCHVPGTAWQKLCTPWVVLGRKALVGAKTTPDVPRLTKAPSSTIPMPQRRPHCPPAPPATTVPGRNPHSSARHGRRVPEISVPSQSRGICDSCRLVAAKASLTNASVRHQARVFRLHPTSRPQLAGQPKTNIVFSATIHGRSGQTGRARGFPSSEALER